MFTVILVGGVSVVLLVNQVLILKVNKFIYELVLVAENFSG